MSIRGTKLIPLIVGAAIGLSNQTGAGILKSLDSELNALVRSTEPYLVTVRGDGGWRNLVATGIVYDDAGHVITSSQIFEATGFNVTFKDGRSFPALKVGVDNFTGLAVLKIQGQQFSMPSWPATGPLESGDWITLVGNSYDKPSTVNFGSFHERTEEGFLSLSLSASPGSSGGAILNIDGGIVGVLVARDNAGNNGVGGSLSLISTAAGPNALRFLEQMGGGSGRSYAVPFETARFVAAQIIEKGHVSRGYLGLRTQDISSEEKQKYKVESGVRVAEIDQGSSADSAGLQKGDIIVSFDTYQVKDRTSLFYMVRSHKPGDSVELGIVRDNRKMELRVCLTEAPEENFIGNFGSLSAALGTAKDLPANGLDGLESELATLRKEIDRLHSQLSELKKELGK
jgi:serine protease Do